MLFGKKKKKEELPFRPGMTTEILTMQNDLQFIGKVERFSGGVLQIREAQERELPQVVYGTEWKVRCFSAEREPLTFTAKICGSSAEFWRFEKMTPLFQKDQRAYFRQGVKIEAKVMCMNNVFGAELVSEGAKKPAQPRPCTILDISGGGVLISTKEVYQSGDWLFVLDAELLEEDEPYSFTVRVRSVREKDRERLYGCQYEGIDTKEQDQLLKAIFAMQRKMILQRRESRAGAME